MNRFLAIPLTLALLATPAIGADVVATVGGQDITLEELETALKPQLLELSNSRYELLEGGLQEMIAQRLLDIEAEAKGMEPQTLLEEEVFKKITEPTEEEIAAVYEASKSRLGGAALEDVRERIIGYLVQEKSGGRTQAYIGELRKKHGAVVKLEAPRFTVTDGGRLGRGGPDDAPIQIIVWSDYECPFCARGEEVLQQVVAKYGDKVRHVHRDFPLAFHANAHLAAEGAHCAVEMGKFWEYHDGLFLAEGLEPAQLKALAGTVGLDQAKFDECIDSGRHSGAVDVDMAEGASLGVNGTPAFFINGRSLSGAQPFEKFEEVIDAELAKLEASAS